MNWAGLLKPEYIWNRHQLIRRLLMVIKPPTCSTISVDLPWQLPIRIHLSDSIGKAIVHLGVFDLAVTETLWRLTGQGEMALDIGANIGYMTSVLATRVHPGGRVLSFEPHPDLFIELQANIANWSAELPNCHIQPYQLALGCSQGTATMHVPSGFAANRGTCRVVPSSENRTISNAIIVPSDTLDNIIADLGPIGIAKLDVEGSELMVLRGATRILAAGIVRDWIFEDFHQFPSPLTDLFASHGYTVFHVRKDFHRPTLLPGEKYHSRSSWESPSLLATLNPGRAIKCFHDGGWLSLKRSHTNSRCR
jgi:FkbM family methyltransferase